MSDLGEIFGVFTFIMLLIFGFVKCDSCLDEHDVNLKKLQDARIAACFPSILDKEIEIDGIKYVICHSEPGSKDYKIKEFAK